VALPFIPADDGLAPGEAVECLSANAAVMRAEALSRKPGCAGRDRIQPEPEIWLPAEFGDAQPDPQVRRRAGRSELTMEASPGAQ